MKDVNRAVPVLSFDVAGGDGAELLVRFVVVSR